MCTMNWPKERVLEFIDEVRANPSLWDADDADYRDRQGKKDGWQAVGHKFGINAEEAYKKFRSLRTYAKNEVKRRTAAGKRSSWFAYDAISFILCRDAADSAAMDAAFHHHGTMEVEGTTYTCDPDYVPHTSLYSQLAAKRPRKRKPEEEDEEEEEKIHIASVSSCAVAAPPAVPVPPPPPPPAPATLPVHQGIHIIKESDNGRARNAHSAFGEHVANKMAAYSDHVRSEVELKISQVLYEADRKMFNQRESGCQCALICFDSDDKDSEHKN